MFRPPNLAGARFIRAPRSFSGFTLFELLLTLAVLTLLVGAAAITFTSFGRGHAFTEGVAQLEMILRLARAEAANSGKIVQLQFIPPTTGSIMDTDAASPSAALQIRIESNPFDATNRFTSLTALDSRLSDMEEQLQIEWIRPGAVSADSIDQVVATEDMNIEPQSALIRFYPDGSSDTATLLARATEPEDTRQALIRLEGITGILRSQFIWPDAPESAPEITSEISP